MIGIIIGVVIVVLSAVILLCWKRVPADKAVVVTGLKKRVITGGGGVVIPLLEQAQWISLENIKVEVRTNDSLDFNGVPIDVDSTIIAKLKDDEESILMAMQQFHAGGEKNTVAVIKDIIKDVLTGKLREIISKLTIEEIHKDREKFSDMVEEVAKSDLEKMGIEIKTFTCKDIADQQGYLEALGAKQIARVKKDAEIAKAEAEKEQYEVTSELNRKGEEAKLKAETEIEEAKKEKAIKLSKYKEEQEKARAKAEFAFEVEKNNMQKQIINSKKDAELVEETRQIEIAEKSILKKEKELEATIKKVADAERYDQEIKAEAEKFKKLKEAEVEAEAIKIRGKAEAEAIRLKGQATADAMLAEAQALEKKARVYQEFGQSVILESIAAQLPEISKNIAEPLSKVDNMTIIDNGGQGGASKVTKNVTNIMAELPKVVESLTGLNMIDLITNIPNNNKEVKGTIIETEDNLEERN